MTLTILILLALLTASAVGTAWVIHTYHHETRYSHHATATAHEVDSLTSTQQGHTQPASTPAVGERHLGAPRPSEGHTDQTIRPSEGRSDYA
jgi:hypothetical protein